VTPEQLAKSGSEHAHQVALFAYVAMARLHGFDAADAWADGGMRPLGLVEGETPAVPELEWYHAIPNGGARGDKRTAVIRGAGLKAEGVRSGVADTFLPVQRGGYPGLYIELKKPSERPKRGGSGGLSEEQLAFKAFVRSQGYGWCVCYGWREAASVLRQYMEQR
jgi:hypothetical protein